MMADKKKIFTKDYLDTKRHTGSALLDRLKVLATLMLALKKTRKIDFGLKKTKEPPLIFFDGCAVDLG